MDTLIVHKCLPLPRSIHLGSWVTDHDLSSHQYTYTSGYKSSSLNFHNDIVLWICMAETSPVNCPVNMHGRKLTGEFSWAHGTIESEKVHHWNYVVTTLGQIQPWIVLSARLRRSTCIACWREHRQWVLRSHKNELLEFLFRNVNGINGCEEGGLVPFLMRAKYMLVFVRGNLCNSERKLASFFAQNSCLLSSLLCAQEFEVEWVASLK